MALVEIPPPRTLPIHTTLRRMREAVDTVVIQAAIQAVIQAVVLVEVTVVVEVMVVAEAVAAEIKP